MCSGSSLASSSTLAGILSPLPQRYDTLPGMNDTRLMAIKRHPLRSFLRLFSRSNNSNYRYHNHHKSPQSKNPAISAHGNYMSSAHNQTTAESNSPCSVPVPPSPVHHAKQAKVEVPSSPNTSKKLKRDGFEIRASRKQ